MKLFIVGFEDNKWWCVDKTLNDYEESLRSANNEAFLLMAKHHPKRDMSKARIVSDSRIGFGIPRLEAPEYIDYNEPPRKTPEQVWVLEAPNRYQALKIAKHDYNKNLIDNARRCKM